MIYVEPCPNNNGAVCPVLDKYYTGAVVASGDSESIRPALDATTEQPCGSNCPIAREARTYGEAAVIELFNEQDFEGPNAEDTK